MASRSKFEMIVDFMDKVGQYPNDSLTRVSRYAGLNLGPSRNTIFSLLVEKGFVAAEITKTRRCYKRVTNVRLTSLGFCWLHKAQLLLKELH